MAKITAAIGRLFGIKEPKADPGIALMQQKEQQDTRRKSAELAAEKAAMLEVSGTGRLGRARLAFRPTAPASATPTTVGQTLG